MSITSQFWIWVALGIPAWLWVITSDIRSGELGWSFAKLRRSQAPQAFWTIFTAKHLAIFCLVAFLVSVPPAPHP